MIYTTYFAKTKKLDAENTNLISIARKTPPGFKGRVFLSLAPSSSMLWDVKETGDKVTYTKRFMEYLNTLDADEIVRELGEDPVLVCYEKYGDFCHRHLVGIWLKSAGHEVQELLVA